MSRWKERKKRFLDDRNREVFIGAIQQVAGRLPDADWEREAVHLADDRLDTGAKEKANYYE